MSGDTSPMVDETHSSGSFAPWLFLAGLLAVIASLLLFVFTLVRGGDIVRPVVLNAVGAAILVAVAAYDTRRDPNSVVTETTGAVGTALLLYGLYLFASGLVILVTSVVHGRFIVGVWAIGLAVLSVVVGVLSFPTRRLLDSKEQSASEQYAAAVDACAAAAEHIHEAQYDQATTRYDDIETAMQAAVRATDATGDDADSTASETESDPVATVLTGLDDQADTAVEAGKSHLSADDFGAATAALTAAQRALATRRAVAAMTDHEQAADLSDREETITAWVEMTDGLATAAGAAEAGGVASALQALDGAGEAVTDRQRPIFDEKRTAILAAVERTRRETAAERLAAVEARLEDESFTAVDNARAAIQGVRAGIESLDDDVSEGDPGAVATALRERTRAWTTVTDRVTVGAAKLEDGDDTGVLALLEAALVAADALDGATDPEPRQLTAWLRGCERIMDAYGEATAAVETADDHLDDGDEARAGAALERALAALGRAREAAIRAGIDTAYIDQEARSATDQLATLTTAD
jgi:hypothetical protein